MFFLVRKSMLGLWGLLILTAISVAIGYARFAPVSADNLDYRVFVAGLGTVNGKWCGNTGIAVIGLETRPASEEGKELKVIDLLIANNSSVNLIFNPDIVLLNRHGQHYGLEAEGQPAVVIKAGTMSQGTVVISVPQGIPDIEWLLKIKGGNLTEGVILPLRVVKTVEDTDRPYKNHPKVKD